LRTVVEEFEEKRPFVVLRSDIAPIRAVVERMICRMKYLFRVIAGPVYLLQANFLSCYLIIAAGLINKMIEENPQFFVRDLEADEREQRKKERFSMDSLFPFSDDDESNDEEEEK